MAEARYADIVSLASDFAKGEIAEILKEDDHYPDVPFRESLYAKAEEVGFMSFLLPEEAGGVGETAGALAEVLYEISRTDASVAAVILCQAFAHRLLMEAGKEALAAEAGLIAATLYEDPMDLPVGLNASGTLGGRPKSKSVGKASHMRRPSSAMGAPHERQLTLQGSIRSWMFCSLL